ncbi:hypothetical protein LTR85_009174 [Meristemomyces frigidus]|nr:hypothetical protein LTR85_009174 [Meristemomyces frigidus]
MATLRSVLAQVADKNQELLTVLSQTEYAGPALEQNAARIHELEDQSTATTIDTRSLHKITEDERKDHLRYRGSIVKRFMHNLGGQKGKESFTSKEEKEEREYLEAWQREREATERLEAIGRELEYARTYKLKLELDKVRHDQAQSELDLMYENIFSGPTPGAPEEDRVEANVQSARERFQRCQIQQGNDRDALQALRQGIKLLGVADMELANLRNNFIHCNMSELTFSGAMGQYSLSTVQTSLMKSLQQVREASRLQPAILLLDEVRAGHRDTVGESLHPGTKTTSEKLRTVDARVTRISASMEVLSTQQAQRLKGSEARLQQALQALERARQELQRVRMQAFERYTIGDTAPPPYFSY